MGDIHVQGTTQAGELYTGHTRIIIELKQVIDLASIKIQDFTGYGQPALCKTEGLKRVYCGASEL